MTNGKWQEQDLQDQTRFRSYDQQPEQTQYKAFPQQQGQGAQPQDSRSQYNTHDSSYDPNRSQYEVIEYQPKKRSMFRVFLPVIIFGVIFILIMASIVIFALVGPLLAADVDLEVSIQTAGSVVGDTIYIDTDNVNIKIANLGKGTASADKIKLEVSGKNLFSETIQYDGVDITSDRYSTYNIRIDVIDDTSYLTITVKVFYDGDLHDSDSKP